MPAQTVTLATAGVADSAETIDNGWFGAVQTGWHEVDGFEQSAEVLNLGLVRWPGGTLSEIRPDVYGIDKPGVYDATTLYNNDPLRDRPDLADSLEYTVENGMDFSMIVPTSRYADDIELGETHLRAFLDDLFTGEYGELPEKFTLELGNEYHDLPEFENNPGAYGEVASRFAEIIAERMEMHLTGAEQDGINIAVQMGIDSADNAAILNAFSPEALNATNSLVFHSLPNSLRNLNKTAGDGMNRYERADEFADDWRRAILDAGGDADPDLFMSAWTVGASPNTPDGLDLQWQDYGARQSLVALDTVAGYSSIGVDSAAIWGVDVNNLNTVTSTETGALQLSHTGEMFRMMADSLVGKRYVGDFTPSTRGDHVVTHTFTDGNELTNYIAINELSVLNDEVLLDFNGATNIQLVHAEMLSTFLDPNFDGDYRDLDARLHEMPRTWEMEDIFTEEGLLIDFTTDYEVAEVEVIIGDGLSGSGGDDWIRGDWQNDLIEGGAGDDFLVGGRGFDRLEGGEGDDVLLGGIGNDRLYGGSGDDTLDGGDGNDILGGYTGYDELTGGAGRDWFQFGYDAEGGEITDFEVGTDAIDLSDVFAMAKSVEISGPDYFDLAQDLGPGGDGSTWSLNLSQTGADTLLQVFDEAGDEQMSITLRGIDAEDLTRDFFSSFQLGRDEDLSRDVTQGAGIGGDAPVARPADDDTGPAIARPPAEQESPPIARAPAGDASDETVPPEVPEADGASWMDRVKGLFGIGGGGRETASFDPANDPTATNGDYLFEASDWGGGPWGIASGSDNGGEVAHGPQWFDENDGDDETGAAAGAELALMVA